jgi:hypothetical protein
LDFYAATFSQLIDLPHVAISVTLGV